MNGKVLVVIPSRDRPVHAYSAMVSANSPQSDVKIYVDDDQRDLYKDLIECHGEDRGWCVVGPRVGPVAAANQVIEQNPEYSAYGLITDDSRITTKDWATWLLEAFSQCPNQVGVVSPYHNHGNHVDMPFVSQAWLKAVGWFACPDCYHYCWPTITGLIGEMSAIVHAPMQKFAIEHADHAQDHAKQVRDAQPFYEFVSLKLPPVVERVRSAMYS